MYIVHAYSVDNSMCKNIVKMARANICSIQELIKMCTWLGILPRSMIINMLHDICIKCASKKHVVFVEVLRGRCRFTSRLFQLMLIFNPFNLLKKV